MTRTDASYSINNETDLRFYGQTTDTESPANILYSMNTGGTFVWNNGSGSEQMQLTSTGLGIGASTTGKFLAYQAGSINNYQGAYGSSGTFQTGTGSVTLGGSGNPRGIGVLINANKAASTTLTYGSSYETFGLIAVANVGTGGGYGTTGIAGYAESDGQVIGLRADAKSTSVSGASPAYGLYVGSVTGSTTNYGVYVSDTAASNYFGGNLLVGTTSTGAYTGNSLGYEPAGSYLVQNHASAKASGAAYTYFQYNGSAIGSITQSGTTAVLYNVTSDQRLKENIVDAPEFGSVIDSFKVRSFDWKTDQTHQRAGFIAQELVTVAPEAVHQPIDPDDMMAVDYSKLVPMLVKEIQSLRKRILSLENK